MTRWLPPLLCPIPLGHASHYRNISSNGRLSALLRGTVQRYNFTYRKFASFDPFDNRSFNDDRLQQPSTYYRLFKRRTADKKLKPKKPNIRYVLFTPDGTAIKAVKTFKRAKYLLSLDSVVYRKIYRKEIPIGSYILKTEEDYANFNWEVPTIDDSSPVAVKRCKSCPQITNEPGQCACGFWSAIRDSTRSKVWWPIHDRRMYDIRQAKEEKKTLKIKVSLKDLFDN